MSVGYSESQKNRLTELGIQREELEKQFSDIKSREKFFQVAEKAAAETNKAQLANLLKNSRKVKLCRLQENLSQVLCEAGFTQITTPTILSAKFLEKMTIDSSSPLYGQIFWLDRKTALRPMLAPNLYEVSRQLITSQGLPLRIFEIGSCFRKESEGNSHLKEFTMLNLVEWGTRKEERVSRLKKLSQKVLDTAEIVNYKMQEEDSTVYGPGLDVVSENGLELASTSMGPHPLDDAWKITCTWVGIGFGLERLLMEREKQQGIHRYAKSTVFLDGACLKIK